MLVTSSKTLYQKGIRRFIAGMSGVHFKNDRFIYVFEFVELNGTRAWKRVCSKGWLKKEGEVRAAVDGTSSVLYRQVSRGIPNMRLLGARSN